MVRIRRDDEAGWHRESLPKERSEAQGFATDTRGSASVTVVEGEDAVHAHAQRRLRQDFDNADVGVYADPITGPYPFCCGARPDDRGQAVFPTHDRGVRHDAADVAHGRLDVAEHRP